MKRVFIVMLIVIVGIIAVIFLTYKPQDIRYHSVSDILENPVKLDNSEQVVYLEGSITSIISDSHFYFEDITGRIKIDIEDSLLSSLPQDFPVNVEITGHVDSDIDKGSDVEIEVFDLKY